MRSTSPQKFWHDRDPGDGCCAHRSARWLRLARSARILSWLTLGWLGIEAGVGIGAAIIAGSVALLGFGLDSGIEALASIIVIWRFNGSRLLGGLSERRAQQLVAISFYLLGPYIAVEGILGLVGRDKAETSWVGIALTAGTFLLEPPPGFAKRRLGCQLGSSATAGEGMQNLLCAWLAGAVFVGLVANTVLGWWWLDGTVALLIAAWAVREGWKTWSGAACSCTCGDPMVITNGASTAAPSCERPAAASRLPGHESPAPATPRAAAMVPRWLDAAVQDRALVICALSALARASASMSVLASRPHATPCGATRRADSSTSSPPPEPRSRTVSPGLANA
jgi:hypothetical protein